MKNSPLARSTPITPNEFRRTIAEKVPDSIIDSINNLLVKKADSRKKSISILQSEIWTDISTRINTEMFEQDYREKNRGLSPTYDTLFLCLGADALNFPIAFSLVGWKVERNQTTTRSTLDRICDDYIYVFTPIA